VHEASIVREILDAARERAGAALVTEVHVQVGRLSGVSPDALGFYFEALRGETLGIQARLHVDLAPLRGRCAGCRRDVELLDLAWSCPACAGPLVFEGGAELSLTSLVVDHE
jgi:hydrogenase nickel incorporation protein HypA/HybF